MAVLKFDDVPYEIVREGLQRKIIHTDNLMSVLIDFSDGPWDKPEPPHSHPHEQTSYVAEGEIIFFCEGEADQHLKHFNTRVRKRTGMLYFRSELSNFNICQKLLFLAD